MTADRPRKPGRPPLPEAERRSRTLAPVRINAREGEALDALCARWGCSEAEAVRQAIMRVRRRLPRA